MKVSLREINPGNFNDCVDLSVREDQPYVASNVYSIAESKIYPFWVIKAVFADEQIVGFVMYDLNHLEEELYLCRFMIDKNYQGKGYGIATLDLLKGIAENEKGIKRMKLSTNPKNANGIRIYEKYGFVDTHEMDEGEEVFIYSL